MSNFDMSRVTIGDYSKMMNIISRWNAEDRLRGLFGMDQPPIERIEDYLDIFNLVSKCYIGNINDLRLTNLAALVDEFADCVRDSLGK